MAVDRVIICGGVPAECEGGDPSTVRLRLYGPGANVKREGDDLRDGMYDRFPAAFAEHTDHDNIRSGALGQHREQDRLADPGAREQTHALAAPQGAETVDGAHAEFQTLAQARAGMGGRRRAI